MIILTFSSDGNSEQMSAESCNDPITTTEMTTTAPNNKDDVHGEDTDVISESSQTDKPPLSAGMKLIHVNSRLNIHD